MKKFFTRFTSLLLFTSLLSANSQAQNIITTIAGNGTADFFGDNGAATSAELNDPRGVFVDRKGNIYIADTDNNRVRKINAQGVITTIAGTGLNTYGGDGAPAIDAQLNGPFHVVADSIGNVFIADYWNYRTRIINTSGVINTYAGNGSPNFDGYSGLADTTSTGYNNGVALDSKGQLYIADAWFRCVHLVNTSGFMNFFAGTGTAECSGDSILAVDATFQSPNNCAVDKFGNVYIADFNCNSIRMVNTAGIITTFAGNATPGFSGDGGPATSAELNSPSDVAIDDSGNIYIADEGNNVIRKVNPQGIISTLAGTVQGFGGDGQAADKAKLNAPIGVAVDDTGNVYVADYRNQRIRKITIGACNAQFVFQTDSLEPGRIQFISVSNGTDLSYYWTLGDGSTATVENPLHLYRPGQYYPCLTITGGGCTDTYCDSMAVVSGSDSIPTGIANPGAQQIKFEIYPNPASNVINVSIGKDLVGSSMTLTDITGRRIMQQKLSSAVTEVETKSLASGIYFVALDNNFETVRKVVISK